MPYEDAVTETESARGIPARSSGRTVTQKIVSDLLAGREARITHRIGTHTNQYSGVAVDRVGRMLTANRDRTARLWDIASGQCLMEFRGHTDEVRRAAFTPDGEKAVTSGNDGTVRLWDCATGSCLLVMEGHKGDVLAVTVAPDGRYVVSGGWDQTVLIWSASSGQCMHVLRPGPSAVSKVGITRDGLMLVILDTTGELYRCPMAHHEPVPQGINARGRFTDMALTGDGKIICAAGDDGLVSIDILSGERETVFSPGPYKPYKVLLLPDDRQLIACCHKGAAILVIDRSTGEVKGEFSGHKDNVTGMALTSDGKMLCTVSLDFSCRIWDIDRGNPVYTIGRAANAYRLSLSGDGSCLAAVDTQGNAKTWDIGGFCRVITGKTSSIIFSGSPGKIVTGHDDGRLRLWDTAGKDPLVLDAHAYAVRCLAPAADGTLFISGSRDGTVKLWDSASADCVQTYRITGIITRLAFDERDTRLIAESDFLNNRVYIYDLQSGDRVKVLDCPEPEPKKAGISGLRFLPAGKGILSCGYDGYIALWDPFSFQLQQFLKDPEGSIISMEMEKDGRHVLTGTLGGKVKRWDLENGRSDVVYDDPERSILSMMLSPDDTSLCMAFDDGTIGMIDRKTAVMQWAIWNINDGFCWFTPPDEYTPDGWVFTDRDDLLSIVEQDRDGRILGAVPTGDARRSMYIKTRNNPDMVKARLKGNREYAQKAGCYFRALAKKGDETRDRGTIILPKGHVNG